MDEEAQVKDSVTGRVWKLLLRDDTTIIPDSGVPWHTTIKLSGRLPTGRPPDILTAKQTSSYKI